MGGDTRRGPIPERLLNNLALLELCPTMGSCWNWTGYTIVSRPTEHRYGVITIKQKKKLVHRVSYEEFVGIIPDGLDIDHLCRNTLCFNPEHLDPVTRSINCLRGDRKSKKTHCVRGHPLPEDFNYYRPDGRRERRCDICNNQRAVEWQRKQKAAV